MIMNDKQNYEYAVESVYDKGSGGTNKKALQQLLDKYAADGWKLVSSFTNELGKNEARIMGIGLNATMDEIVLIFERNLQEQRQQVPNNQNMTVQKEELTTNTENKDSWTCTACRNVNKSAYQYCPICGEKHHFDWKCGKCKTINDFAFNFCPNCGKKREDKDEKQLSDEIKTGRAVLESSLSHDKILNDISAMKSAAEIYAYVLNVTNASANDKDRIEFVKRLEKLVNLEHSHSSRKEDALFRLNHKFCGI